MISKVWWALVFSYRVQVDDPKSFPPYKGMVPIVLTWFFSPIFTGAAGPCVGNTLIPVDGPFAFVGNQWQAQAE